MASKRENLLRETWAALDRHELRLLLNARYDGPGQYDDRASNPNTLYLPEAREPCRIVLHFRGGRINSVERGPAFDAAEWERVCHEIEHAVLAGPTIVGRDFSFSGFRVPGTWRGERSGVQLLPPPADAPRAPVEMAEHPFLLEFPLRGAGESLVTNFRRMRTHRSLTLLLNVLLARGVSYYQPFRNEHCWARTGREGDQCIFQWV
jgi:hypothetical protein